MPPTNSSSKQMIRRNRPPKRAADARQQIDAYRVTLRSRRRFLITAAGGTVALLFGLPKFAAADDYDPWPTLNAVIDHLLPSESDSPGAADINALGYLRFVVNDARTAADDREFILQGNRWLDDLAKERLGRSFVALNGEEKEQLLRQIARSAAGENWISTLLSYLLEALLTAPAYGGNTDQVGWRWLQVVPGFPLPGPGTRYTELPL